ncbi:MAG: hypothetical protein QXG38_02805 [Candidatus Hadarchaeales archaeon]
MEGMGANGWVGRVGVTPGEVMAAAFSPDIAKIEKPGEIAAK